MLVQSIMPPKVRSKEQYMIAEKSTKLTIDGLDLLKNLISKETIKNSYIEINRTLKSSFYLMLWIDKFHLCDGVGAWLDSTILQVVDLITWDKGKMGMSTFRESTDATTRAVASAQELKKGVLKTDLQTQAGEKFDSENAEAHQKNLENEKAKLQQDLANNRAYSDAFVESERGFFGALSGKGANEAFYREGLKRDNQQSRADYEARVKAHEERHQQARANAVTKSTENIDLIALQAETMAKDEALSFAGSVANVEAMTRHGFMTAGDIANGGGQMTSAGLSALAMNSGNRANALMGEHDRFNNNLGLLSQSMRDMGMDETKIQQIISAPNAKERAFRFQVATRSSTLSGTYNGRSFNLTAGADGQYHGRFDSRLDVTGGYRVDMGDVSAAAAYQVDGTRGMRVVGMADSANRFVQNTVSNVAFYSPAGGMSKVLTNTGMIKANSPYAMGMGKYNQMITNQALRQENALGSGTAGGGVTKSVNGKPSSIN